MKTYRTDNRTLEIEEFEYTKRTKSEIWVDGKRRDIITARYRYFDDVQSAEQHLLDKIQKDYVLELDKALTKCTKLKNAVTAKAQALESNIKRL